MRFQKTTEYAIRVMVYLADNIDGRYSVNHLHQQMHTMAKSKLVNVTQGKQGGYRIIKNLENIYLYHIIDAVEGLDNYTRCVLGFPQCSDETPCSLHKIWLVRQQSIKDMIYETTLADLNHEPINKY